MSLQVLILVAVVLAWIVVAMWRTAVYVGQDMADNWSKGEEFTKDQFGDALWEAVPKSVAWPILAPFGLLGAILWRMALAHGSKLCERPEPAEPKYEPREELLITDELRAIPDRALAAGSSDFVPSASSEKLADLVRQFKHANDETAQFEAVDYPARHR